MHQAYGYGQVTQCPNIDTLIHRARKKDKAAAVIPSIMTEHSIKWSHQMHLLNAVPSHLYVINRIRKKTQPCFRSHSSHSKSLTQPVQSYKVHLIHMKYFPRNYRMKWIETLWKNSPFQLWTNKQPLWSRELFLFSSLWETAKAPTKSIKGGLRS